MKRKVFLGLEFVVLFFGIPLLVYFDKDFIRPIIIILPVLLFIFIILRHTTDFQWKELFRWGIQRSLLIKNGLIVLMSFVLMLVYVYLFERENLFNLPRTNPRIFLALCIFYPLVSAFGQEIIYRVFLFRRYGRLFRKDWYFVLASGITFSFAHIIYYDPISIILAFIGGLYFAWVYQQTRSILISSMLHGLLGIAIFGAGLGQYFWLDMPA